MTNAPLFPDCVIAMRNRQNIITPTATSSSSSFSIPCINAINDGVAVKNQGGREMLKHRESTTPIPWKMQGGPHMLYYVDFMLKPNELMWIMSFLSSFCLLLCCDECGAGGKGWCGFHLNAPIASDVNSKQGKSRKLRPDKYMKEVERCFPPSVCFIVCYSAKIDGHILPQFISIVEAWCRRTQSDS